MKNYVITIARGFGSGGKQVGVRLAQKLNIPCYEHQILDMASEMSGINADMFAQVDEKLRGGYLLNELKKYPLSNVATPTDREFTSNINLFNIQREVIEHLADTESCIIVGKCADYILQDRHNVISVYVEAPRAYCLKQVMERMSVSEAEANHLITKTDRYRAAYYKYYTRGKLWTNPVNYDLVINTDRVGIIGAAELIEAYLDIRY